MNERYNNIKECMEKYQPRTIVEIGTWNGSRAMQMAATMKSYESDIHKMFYYGFDVFESANDELREREMHVKGSTNLRVATKNLKTTGMSFILVKGDTNETLKEFTLERKIDFFYIDGGHSIGTIQNDWDFVAKNMTPDSFVLFDDYYPDNEDFGCKSLVDGLMGSSGGYSESYGDDDDDEDEVVSRFSYSRKSKRSRKSSSKYNVELLEPVDEIAKDGGEILKIQMVLVTMQ
jgi:hypothetical protein